MYRPIAETHNMTCAQLTDVLESKRSLRNLKSITEMGEENED